MNVELHLSNINELSKRRFQRVHMSVPVTIGDKTMRTIDWSVGGVRLPHIFPGLDPWQGEADISIPAEDLLFTLHLTIEHVHANLEHGYAGYRFVDPTEEQHDLLRALVIAVVTDGCFELDSVLQAPFAKTALAKARRDGQSIHPHEGFAITKRAQG